MNQLQKDRLQKGKKITYIMIGGNLLLTILKISIGLIVGSSALVADGFHSFSDIVSSGIVLAAVYISGKPPDETHQYGHGQAEPIAAKIVGIILILTGAFLFYNTVLQIINKNFKILGLMGFWAAVFSIIVKEIMFRYSYKVGEETNNQSLKADAWHHRSDAISSIAAAVGVFGSYLGYPFLDPVAGLLVSGLIIKVGWDIVLEAVNSLLTISPDQEKLNKIKDVVQKVDGVEEISELKAHFSGGDLYIDIKILVDYSLTVMEGHQIAVEVKQELSTKFPETQEVLVHVDPMLT
ncbi:MAG: cation diffusion facilitator family transporter [Bacillota bacterium]